MPGSKRRALKKLLSPHSSPAETPISSNTTANESGTSIASDPNNYMSDEAIQQDLAVEEMMDREKSIGSGMHRMQDGVDSLGSSPANSMPPPPPGGFNGAPGYMSPPPPPPPKGGGMHPAQQMTADELMYGEGPNSKGGKKKSSKQKFAERQARKKDALLHSAPPNDPAWNAQLEKERMDEIQIISGACEAMGREIYEIAPDGHCMFNAIADQLCLIGLLPPQEAENPRNTRQTAANYMLAHPDDFMPFLPSITGEDSAGATEHDGLITDKEFKKYCSNVAETGEWGGEPEIQALSRAFQIPIHVVQRGPPTIVSHGGADDAFGGGLTPEQSAAQGDRVVRISYHKRMYGLGEHYNSLRKAD